MSLVYLNKKDVLIVQLNWELLDWIKAFKRIVRWEIRRNR